ncbi:BQ2448_6540 [Microbotryum intermedium]|uniref:BQ2448_6540 protein n=1 Tax=Microbotryum intermedium TaxID=269621 RepID=A0A238FS96_9BASI|nr:BQ2448_6540 [Microbotryum intermedium]
MTFYFSRLAPDLSRSKPSINLATPGSTPSSSSSSAARSPLLSPSRLLFGRQATSTTPIDPTDTDENRDIEDNKIKCSDCHAFMDVTQLGEHICSESSQSSSTTSTAEVTSPFSISRLANGLKRQVPNGLRIDVMATRPSEAAVSSTRGMAATRVPLGSNGAVAQSTSQSGYLTAEVNKSNLEALQPVTANSIPRSPSATSVSSNSSNKLPFFEKYQRLNTPTASSSSTVGLPRSPNSADLAARANSHRPVSPTTNSRLPAPAATEALYSFPSNGSSLSLASAGVLGSGVGTGRASATRGPSSQPSLRSFRSTESHSSGDRSRRDNSNATAASSVLSNSPPRSRRIVMDERRIVRAEESPTLDHDDFFSAYDDHRRATLKASHSTPNDLIYYSQANEAHVPKSKPTQLEHSGLQSRATPELDSSAPSTPGISIGMTRSKGSNQTLDDCLEDLRMMTESDDEEEYDPLSSEYYDRRLTSSGPFDEDIELERTPKVSTPLSQSRSTPALSSSAALESIVGSGLSATRAPYSNPNRIASAASSKLTAYPPRGSSSATVKKCTTCRRDLSNDLKNVQKAGDGQVFCRVCYAERFLPKCRKCCRAIESGAVTSSDGKVLGKYHKDCFTCFTCSVPFPDGDFYVYDHKPYCQMHYHKLNGSLCANVRCGQPIEGPCVSLVGAENGGGGRYHVDHFVCSYRACGIALLEHHFVVSGLPYCERHAEVHPPRLPTAAAGSSRSKPLVGGGRLNPPPAMTTRAKKRQTIITRRY